MTLNAWMLSSHDRYVAIHIGGYRQPKREWLDQIRTGRDGIPLDPVSSPATVTVDGDTAILDARRLSSTPPSTAAAQHGRFLSRTVFTLTPEGWKAISSEASTY